MKLAPGRVRLADSGVFVVGRLFGALGDSWALDSDAPEGPRGAVEIL
jgi:hypothetical protein